MANLGNAWHIPASPEPRNLAGMRSPVGSVVSGTAVRIFSGNQFQGGGNPGNQLQVGSAMFFQRAGDAAWQSLPLLFFSQLGNNKYFVGMIPADTFQTAAVVQYYLRIAYDDHDATFVHLVGGLSATTELEATARAAPFTFTVEDRALKGQWGPVFELPNVAIHTHVLPNGRVLMWGRRDEPTDTLDVHVCTPFVWNPADNTTTPTNQPKLADGTTVNLFCSGHSFLPDGRLLVVGGHLFDGDGLSQASLYDWRTNSWAPTAPMTTPTGEAVRRWYPTATTLPDGTVLVLSGSYVDPTKPAGQQSTTVDLLQVWDNGRWKTIPQADGTSLNFFALPLYPRMHVLADGRVFMSGSNDRTMLLKTTAPGEWTQVALRSLGNRDYCPAVRYDTDKVVYIGGGNDADTHVPTADVELIDLSANPAQWRRAASMHNRRRQHNATLLPNGTVLVTGGTRGGGGPNIGFNDLAPGEPVHVAELWDPASDTWTELTAEEVPRCYHATAVILPDATVLSAGGGEYRPDNVNDNDPEDSHRNLQVFSPPYLFQGPRPVIASAPSAIGYGDQFQIPTPQASGVAKVTLIGLPSVTHAFDQHQRVNFLPFTSNAAGLSVTAPASANACPPGHYMLFLVNQAGVPSVAAIVQVRPTVSVTHAVAEPEAKVTASVAAESARSAAEVGPKTYLRVYARATHVASVATGTPVVVGITGTCPYGIGACWGGAYEALGRLEAVELVSPIANTDDSTANVFLSDGRLPPLGVWQQQFRGIVNGSYELRGVELTLVGAIEARDHELYLLSGMRRPAVRLTALRPTDKIQWHHASRTIKPLDENEASAYGRLLAQLHPTAQNPIASVTGPLQLSDAGYTLHVRQFSFTG